jgi:hypothetical protein
MAKNYKDINYFETRPDIVKIFNDLEAWHDHCRIELIDFNPADLYKSQAYKDFSRRKNGFRTGYQGKNPRPGYNNKPHGANFNNKPRFNNERFSR